MPLPSTRVVHRDRTSEVADVLCATRPQCGTIYERRMVKSAAGGDTETLVVKATDVPFRARVQGRRAIAGDVGGEATEAERWELSFDRGTDIKSLDRFVAVGRTWDILSAGPESYEPEVRALAVEVTS